MTLAVAHRDAAGKADLDCLREARPPVSPEAVVERFVADLARYRIGTVAGDNYAKDWPQEQFRKRVVRYEVSARARSDIYLALLPMINARTVELLDDPKLLAQLTALERRTTRTGKDAIDHGPGGHDDVINAAAGALVLAGQHARGILDNIHVCGRASRSRSRSPSYRRKPRTGTRWTAGGSANNRVPWRRHRSA